MWFFQREFTPDFNDIILVTLGVAVVNGILVFFLLPMIDILVVIPAALIVGLVLMYFCSLPLSHASIATVVYLGYKIGLIFLLS